MGKLSYEELILLNNLVYIDLDSKEDDRVIDIVNKLINFGDFDYLMSKVGNCIVKMPESDWIKLLQLILLKPNLVKLRIKDINGYYKNKMKYACFVDEEDSLTVALRGTTSSDEWEDTAHSSYEIETKEQVEALKYINSLEYENITITGHSKGGNKSEYVAILSPKVDRCISVDGQGFSNEFINKYEDEISNNKHKIISINAKYDYVNCLFNKIQEKRSYIKTDFQLNPFYYHKVNVLLDKSGNLKKETDEGAFTKIINSFSIALISDLPHNLRNMIINMVIDTIELFICKGKFEKSILDFGEELLIKKYNTISVDDRKNFIICSTLFDILISPLIFWNELIYIEENNSRDLLPGVINKIIKLENIKINNLMIICKGDINLLKNISYAFRNLVIMLGNELY